MRILKEVNIDSWVYLKKCCNCFSELEINANDIECNSLFYELYFTCPICKDRNVLEYLEIPNKIITNIKDKLGNI